MVVIACDICKKTNLEVPITFYRREYALRVERNQAKPEMQLVSIKAMKIRPIPQPGQAQEFEDVDICINCTGTEMQKMLNVSEEKKPKEINVKSSL